MELNAKIRRNIQTAERAAQAGRQVRIVYRDVDGEPTYRNVDPSDVFYSKAGAPLLRGICHLRGEVRAFRLDRADAIRLVRAGREVQS